MAGKTQTPAPKVTAPVVPVQKPADKPKKKSLDDMAVQVRTGKPLSKEEMQEVKAFASALLKTHGKSELAKIAGEVLKNK